MKKILISTIFGTIFFCSTIGLNNHNSIATKTSNITNNSNKQIQNSEIQNIFFDYNSIYNNLNTPYGFIKIDSTSKQIKMISYFGNISWTYNLKTSVFVKRINNSPNITSIKATYIESIDRIIIYGNVDTSKSFLFQLDAQTGDEYFVNPNDKTPSGSSIIYSDNNMISNINLVSYMNNETIIVFPKTWNSSKQINTFNINLNSYISSPINFDYQTFINNFDVNGLTGSINNYTFGEIIGYVSLNKTNSINLFLMKAIVNTSSNNKLGILAIATKPNMEPIKASFIGFDEITISASIQNELDNYNFELKSKRNGNNFDTYVILQNKSYQEYGISNQILFYSWDNSSNFVSKKIIYNLTDATNNKKIKITQIFHNYFNNRIYILGYDSSNKMKWYINEINFNDSSNNQTINITTNLDFSTSFNSQDDISNMYFLFVNDQSILSNNSNSYPGIIFINTNDSKQLKTFILDNNNNITLSNNFIPTYINSYDGISQKYSNYLPQDITIDIFNEFIYLYNNENINNHLFESKITIDNNNPLKIDNVNGRLNGTIYLNLRKWWVNNNLNQYQSFPISININGLATNAGLSFALVLSSQIDSQKYSNILELKKTKYPTEISKQEIIDNFLKFGNNLEIDDKKIDIIDVSNLQKLPSPENVITVYANDKIGTLEIIYNLQTLTSPSMTQKTGSGLFNNFKQLDTWQQIRLDNVKWANLRKTKMPFQITKQDIIECLELSQSYKTDLEYWTWIPKYNIDTSKIEYINENINGEISGTISYNRILGNTPENIESSKTQLIISPQYDGNNFLTIQSMMGGDSENCIFYNESKANQIASSYSLQEAKNNAYNIFLESMTFFNNWTTIDSLIIGNPFAEKSTLSYSFKFKNDIIETNFKNANGNNLILDSDWINAIKHKSTVLDINRTFSFEFNQTIYEWNYGIPSNANKFKINEIMITDNSMSQSAFNNLIKNLPSIFVKKFFNEQTNSYMDFQNELNFLVVDESISEDDISFFKIKSLQLVANDTNGTVIIQYTINYPNIGDISSGGTTIFPQIILYGFLTTENISTKWINLAIIISSIILFIFVLFITFSIISRKRNLKNKLKYSSNYDDKSINLEKHQTIFTLNDKKRKTSIRNTLNKNSLNTKKHIQSNKRIKEYKKVMKEIKKQKNSKHQK